MRSATGRPRAGTRGSTMRWRRAQRTRSLPPPLVVVALLLVAVMSAMSLVELSVTAPRNCGTK